MIRNNVKSVLDRIEKACARRNRDPASVRLVAATKTVGPDKIKEAVDAGIAIFGENRVQEAKDKIERIGRGVEWHFIGHLQKNKVKYILNLFDMIQSVDSIELAESIDKRAETENAVCRALIQVNVGREENKSGVDPEDLLDTLKQISRLPRINVGGLMAIPPFSEDPENSRPYFRVLREIAKKVESAGIEGIRMDEMSFGMTNDFEVAVEEGATLVRIGRAIFGERN